MEVQEKTNFSICGFTIKEGHVVVVYCILNETSMHLHKFSGGSWNGEVISCTVWPNVSRCCCGMHFRWLLHCNLISLAAISTYE